MSKPKLLVVELWRVGDLAIASPFLRQAVRHYAVTLVAQPMASELQHRFWPEVRVIPFEAPWTVFRGKYQLHKWPWIELNRLIKVLRTARFEHALSARWDPRDHLLLWLSGARQRIGYSRLVSGLLLTDNLPRPSRWMHRYDLWRMAGETLGIDLPARQAMPLPGMRSGRRIAVHTGAGAPVRVWPLENWRLLISNLRRHGCEVVLLCDPMQREAWLGWGENNVRTPASIAELLDILEQANFFIGHDSGPGHLAALMGLPTFTIFGPQLAESFVPVHPQAQWIDGRSCPYKPCFDYCRFPVPHCIRDIPVKEVSDRIINFLRNLGFIGC
jgi:heptosyltransferase-2